MKDILVGQNQLFHEGDPYHIETSLLIRTADQWTGFYMMGTSIMKELKSFHLTLPASCISRRCIKIKINLKGASKGFYESL